MKTPMTTRSAYASASALVTSACRGTATGLGVDAVRRPLDRSGAPPR